MSSRTFLILLIPLILLSACASTAMTPPPVTAAPTETPAPTFTPQPQESATPAEPARDPSDWQNWPVIPIVPASVGEVYQLGQTLGNDPHAFSVFGDCQSESDVFMGVYETDSAQAAALSPDLQEAVTWFTGSFNRPSPTIKPGTTTGALIWNEWTEGKYGCQDNETPVTCELRIHKPSFVIIHIGTHYEVRDEDYMRMIIEQLLAAGIIPILTTKADNRGVEDVNSIYARLAVEYDLPLWNFWAAVSGLPDRGLYTKAGEEFLGNIYLTEPALAIQRLSALEVLNAVWRGATGK